MNYLGNSSTGIIILNPTFSLLCNVEGPAYRKCCVPGAYVCMSVTKWTAGLELLIDADNHQFYSFHLLQKLRLTYVVCLVQLFGTFDVTLMYFLKLWKANSSIYLQHLLFFRSFICDVFNDTVGSSDYTVQCQILKRLMMEAEGCGKGMQ